MKIYKSIFIVVVFIFQIQIIRAQDMQSMVNDAKIGVKAALNLADMTVNPSHQIDTKILGGLGAFAQMNISDEISFQPELILSFQGGKQHTFAPNVTDYEYITDEKLTYLLLPLMGQYHFEQFYVEAGLQPAFLLSANYHYQAIENGEVVLDNQGSISDQTNTFDLSFNIGAGYQINDQLSIGMRYSKGLLAINKSNKVSLKNSVISFSVGYVIFN